MARYDQDTQYPLDDIGNTGAAPPPGGVPEGYVWDEDSGTYVWAGGTGDQQTTDRDNPIDYYYGPGPTPTPAPTPVVPPPGPGPGPGPGTGHLLDPFTGTFTPPSGGIDEYWPELPVFTPPNYTPPPAFAAPTGEEAEQEPGYQFGVDQATKRLEQSRAAQGIRLTGGTLKDILDYGRNAARQQYADVYGRKLKTYETNYGTQYADPYKFAFDAAVEAFKPKMANFSARALAGQREHENQYQQAWDRFMFDYDKWKDQRDSTWDKNFQYAND